VSQLTNDGRNDYAAWSPDGQRIVFSRNFPNPATGNRGVSDIYIMNADGSNVVRRTTGANFTWATWSPDGQTFAVTSGDWYWADIHLISVEDDGLPPRLFVVGGRSPQWSPDGEEIVYVTTSWDDGYHQIFVANVDGTGSRALTVFDEGGIQAASWSPSGDRIAYSKCLDGACRLYIMNEDGSGTRAVANSVGANSAAWSPDGLWIVLRQPDVRVISPDGAGQTLLITNAYHPTWRP
jgi:Tol biopolymer transport system component